MTDNLKNLQKLNLPSRVSQIEQQIEELAMENDALVTLLNNLQKQISVLHNIIVPEVNSEVTKPPDIIAVLPSACNTWMVIEDKNISITKDFNDATAKAACGCIVQPL